MYLQHRKIGPQPVRQDSVFLMLVAANVIAFYLVANVAILKNISF